MFLDEGGRMERLIVAYKLYAKSDSNKGFICPVAEIKEEKYFPLNRDNFCDTEKVFITSGYSEDIDNKFNSHDLFIIDVNESSQKSELVDEDKACTYVSQGYRAKRLRPRECIQIVKAELPDPNVRKLNISRPITEYIFLLNSSNECLGPFKWTLEEDDIIQLHLITTTLPTPPIRLGNIFKISRDSINDFCCMSKGLDLMFDISSATIGAASFDYSSDEEVARFCTKIAGEVNLQANTKSILKNLEGQVRKFPKFNNTFVRERLEHLNNIVDSQLLLQEEVINGLFKFLRTTNGELIVDQYVNNNEDKYLMKIKDRREEEIEKEIFEKKNELNNVLEKIKAKKEDFSALSLEVEQKREAAKSTIKLEEASQRWDEALNKKQEEYSNLEDRVNKLNEQYKDIAKYDNIRQQITDIEAEKRVVNKQLKDLEDNLKSIKAELSTSDEDLQKKLRELKPYVDAVNGSFLSNQAQLPEVNVVPKYYIDTELDKIILQKQFIDNIQEKLKGVGRGVSQVDIVNLVISTQQSFICFLAGLPGVGKTSLTRLFVEAQGLNSRFKEISVARGWTSQKDLIGFFNPLSNRFQSTSSNLSFFLRAIDEDSRKGESPMAYVLLDEANLSPIEHYWSIFMGMTDTTNKILTLGQDIINIPSCLRFIATINYDSTTEPLSPRIVDRAPIIILDVNFAAENIAEINRIKFDLPASEKVLNDLFGCSLIVPELTENEEKCFFEIKKILREQNLEWGRPLFVSPRKENAIRQYCDKARAIMQTLNDGDEFMALDFAILQHVLPQIRGNGSKFKNRLIALKQILESENLHKSTEYLNRMISYGSDELHTYDFFCW